MDESNIDSVKFYNLTHPQKRIWYLENIYPNTSLFNIGGPVRIKGAVDLTILKNAVNCFIYKNEGIRLRIVKKDNDVKQYISEFREIDPDFIDFSLFEQPEEKFNKWVEEQAQKPFSLLDNDLFEFSFFKISDSDYGYLPRFHHIIADGWSMMLLTEQITQNYTDILNNRLNISENNPSYIDYINKENAYLNSERFNKNKAFWNSIFKTLPAEFTGTSSNSIRGRRKTYNLNISMSNAIRKFAEQHKISLNTFFIFIYLLYINKTSGQCDIILGTPVLNRSGEKEKKIFGMFTNAMPCRFIQDEKSTIIEGITKLNEEILKYYFNQKYPYELLAKDLELKKNGIDNLYNVCVNYYNTRLSSSLNGMQIENTEFYCGNQVYSLQFVIKDWSESEITFEIDYKSDDYSEEQIIAMYDSFLVLIDKILNNTVKLSELSLLTEKMKKELITDFNNTKTNYSKSKTIIQLFQEQVLKNPERIAVCHKNRSLTYRELNQRSNQLARYLIKIGVQKEDIIGLCLKHSVETLIAILAVLKSGGAYMPIEPDYPEDRLNYMLEDSKCRILLTNFVFEKDSVFNGQITNINDEQLYTAEADDIIPSISKPENLAYIIYTSGSMGKPKGVMIENKSLVNYVEWAKKMYIKSDKEIFALYSSLAFDLTVTSIFTPLISGNKIEIYRQEDSDDEYILYKIIKERKATVIKLTPSHLSLLKDMDFSESSVKRFIVGGENLKVELAHSIFQSFNSNVEIYNEYGPTEATVGCMIHKYECKDDEEDSVPIGIPAENTQIYILDRNLNPVPRGVCGEMYISGDGLARGYLNIGQLTDERFIDNPFIKGQKMYKTGDSAKFNRENQIIYIGRYDNQVKIRGNRIELAEIEKILLKHKIITKAVVIDRENERNGYKYLCAYVVTKSDVEQFDCDDIKEYVRKHLPGYMVPAFFIKMDKIPLTINGKIDKAKLPVPNFEGNSKNDTVTYTTTTEEILIETIKDVLNIDKINMNDHFYQIGGDSISAIQISSKLNQRGYILKTQDIITNPTIQDMSAFIKFKEKVHIDQSICKGYVATTPITAWFFHQNFKNINHYNQSIILELKQAIKANTLEKTFNVLIKYHDTLRLNYDKNMGKMFYNNTNLELNHKIDVHDLSDLSEEQQNEKIKQVSAKIKSSFDIEKDLLMKVCYFELGDGRGKILITAHHLIIDGISWRILIQDIYIILKQIESGQDIRLPDKTHSYQKWAENVNDYRKRISLLNKQYWETFEAIQDRYQVKTIDRKKNYQERIILTGKLGHENTDRLLTSANKPYSTKTEELLIIALAQTVKELTMEKNIIIELESHGREDVFDDLDITRSIGWFTSIYPLRLSINDNEINNQIKSLKEQIRRVPLNGFDYGVLKYIGYGKEAFFKKDIHSEIRFNYLGNFSTSLENEFFTTEIKLWEDDIAKCNVSQEVLNIICYIVNNQLFISAGYPNDNFKGIFLEDILNRYKDNLENLLEYCCNKEKLEFTPSDFDITDISQEELDSLFYNS